MEPRPSGEEPDTEPVIRLQGRPVLIMGFLLGSENLNTYINERNALAVLLPRPQPEVRLCLHEFRLRVSFAAGSADWKRQGRGAPPILMPWKQLMWCRVSMRMSSTSAAKMICSCFCFLKQESFLQPPRPG